MKSSVAAEQTSGRAMKPGLSFDASSFTNSEEDFLTVLEFISNLDISGSVSSASPVLQGEELLTPDCGRGQSAPNSVDSVVALPSKCRKENGQGYVERPVSPASKHGIDVVDNFFLNESSATDKEALNAKAAVTEDGPVIPSTAWESCQVESAKSGSHYNRLREQENVKKRGVESVSLLEKRYGNGAHSVGAAQYQEAELRDTQKLGLVALEGTKCAHDSTAFSKPVKGAAGLQVHRGSTPSKGSKKGGVPDPSVEVNTSSKQSRRYSFPNRASLEVIQPKGLAIRTAQRSGGELERGPSIQHLTRCEMTPTSLPVYAKKSDLMRRHSTDSTQKLHSTQVELLSLPRRTVCTNGSGQWRDLDQLYEEVRLTEEVRDDVKQRAVRGKKASGGRHHTHVASSSVKASNRQVWDKPDFPADHSCEEPFWKDKRRTDEVSRATVSLRANNLDARTRSGRHVTDVDDCGHVELDAGKCTGKRRNGYSLNARQEEIVAYKSFADIPAAKARYDRSKVSRSASGARLESSNAQQSNSGITTKVCQQPLRPQEQKRDSYPLFSMVDKPTHVLDVPFLSKRNLVTPSHHSRLSNGSEISEACDDSPTSSTDSNATLKQLLYLQKYREVCTLRQALQEEDSDTVFSGRKGSVSSQSNGSWHKKHVVDTVCYCYVRNSSGKAVSSEKTSKITQKHVNMTRSLSDGRNIGLDRSLASQSISTRSLSSHAYGAGLSFGERRVQGEERKVCRGCPQENSAPARMSYEWSSSKKGDLQDGSLPDGLTLVERVFNDNGYFQRSKAVSTLSKGSNVERIDPESTRSSSRWTNTLPQSMKFSAMTRPQQHPEWDKEKLGRSSTECVACEALNLEDRSRRYVPDSSDFPGPLITWDETVKSRQPRGSHVSSLSSRSEKQGEHLKLDGRMEGQGGSDKRDLLTGDGGTFAGVATKVSPRHETPWRKMAQPCMSYRSSRYSFPSDELENVEKFLQEPESCQCGHRHSSSETPFDKEISRSANAQSHLSSLASGSGFSFDCPRQRGNGQQRRSLSPCQDRRLTIWSFYTEVTFFEGIVRLAKASLRNFCACLINCREEFLNYESRDLAALLRNFLPEAQFAEAQHRHFGIQACLNDTIFLHFHEESYGLDPARYAFPSTRFRREVFLEKFHRLSCVFPEQGINMPHKHVHNGELQDFYQFCRRKLSMIQKRMGLKIESWPRLLLHSFFDAMKQVWRVHKLAFSLEPPATMLYIDRGTDFNEAYMELVDMHSMIGDFVISGAKWNFVPHPKEDLPSAPRNPPRPDKIPGDPPSEATVEFMVMPGFEVKSKVLKSQVYLKPRTA